MEIDKRSYLIGLAVGGLIFLAVHYMNPPKRKNVWERILEVFHG